MFRLAETHCDACLIPGHSQSWWSHSWTGDGPLWTYPGISAELLTARGLLLELQMANVEWNPGLLTTLLAITLLSCNGSSKSSEGSAFSYETTNNSTLRVLTLSGGAALPRVTVTLARRTGSQVLESLFHGMTDDAGLVQISAQVLTEDQWLELISAKPGYVGPYSDETWRTQLGTFAPSSWIVIPASQTGQLRIELKENMP